MYSSAVTFVYHKRKATAPRTNR